VDANGDGGLDDGLRCAHSTNHHDTFHGEDAMNQPPQGQGPQYGQYAPGPGYGAPQQGYPPPPKKGPSVLMIVVIVLGGLALLAFGSCFVCAAVVGNTAKNAAEAMSAAANGAPLPVRQCEDYLAKVKVCLDRREPGKSAEHEHAINGMRSVFAIALNPIVTATAGGKAMTKDALAQKCQESLDKFAASQCR